MRKITNPASEIPLPGFEQFHSEFIVTRKEELIVLEKALKDSDFKALKDQCHKWRGFSAPYGFQELGLLANQLDDAALSNNAQSCGELLKRIAEYLGED